MLLPLTPVNFAGAPGEDDDDELCNDGGQCGRQDAGYGWCFGECVECQPLSCDVVTLKETLLSRHVFILVTL